MNGQFSNISVLGPTHVVLSWLAFRSRQLSY